MRRLRVLAVTCVLAAAGLGLTGCHRAPADVCNQYKPHTGDSTVYAEWDGNQTRYECGYHHPGSIVFINHTVCIYPGEHYSPPDDHDAKQSPCSF